MSEIIQEWVLDRLGVILNMSPEMFAEKVKDGYLLATILKSYEFITEEQLSMISKSESLAVCLSNFQEHIITWLNTLGICMDDEELDEIVNAKGTAALNLFYKVYLELHGKNKLHFIAQQKLMEKLRPKGRFEVERVQEAGAVRQAVAGNIYDQPLRDAKDIIHWQKDKMQMLQAKCKDAREEYLQYVRNSVHNRGKMQRIRTSCKFEVLQSEVVADTEDDVASMTYEQLQWQQKDAAQLPKFVPDLEQSRKILKKIRVKHSEHAENLMFKTELQRDIFTAFWDKVKKDEEERLNKTVTDAILKQSLYEQQIQKKIGEVKLQKHNMLANKRKEADAISKQITDDFVHKMILKDKELNERELTYHMEKERLLELHQRLYQRKLKLKHEMAVKICTNTVSDLVNLACQEAEYIERVGEKPPMRLRELWKKMFVRSIPLDDYVSPMEIILKKPEERPEDLEEIIHLEIERQEVIDDEELRSYLGFQSPWILDNIEHDEKGLNDMVCALNVLGNVVHNLLMVKYPYPKLPVKPDFPKIKVSACVNSLDVACLPLLQEFLELRNILVVQVQDCVNFCIKAYIEETTVEVDASEPKEDKGKKGKGKEKQKNKGKDSAAKESKSDKKSAKGGKNKMKLKPDEAAPTKLEFRDKMVQTPRYYPDEVIPLTQQAELGKIALEVLEGGDALNKHLVAAMFVEYIKSKPDLEGWVLINFPQTYEEASALEEFLTGLPVPRLNVEEDLSIIDLEELETNPDIYKKRDSNLQKRISRMLPQPVLLKDPAFYDTALTAYIKVIKRETEKHTVTLEDIEDNPDYLDKFYADLGCNYHFYYTRLDYDATKYLAKLVLGDYSVPMKTSVELFGDEVTLITAESRVKALTPASASKRGEKVKKPKDKRMESPTKKVSDKESKPTEKGKEKDKKGKKFKVVIVHEDKSTQIPEAEEDEEVAAEAEQETPPKAGEKNWPYVNIPFSQDLQVAFATMWENAEDVYMVDLEQVFFLKRTILNAVQPFLESVQQHIATFMNKTDEKQMYLREFQKIYNEFDDDFRADEDFKAEMFCRISEFREKLIEVCDWKMIATDHERVFIIERNWTAIQMIQLANQYVTAMQLELDRCVDSMMLLIDYYTAVVTKMASETTLPKEILSRLPLVHVETSKQISSLLQYVSDSKEESLHQFMEHTVKHCRNIVDHVQQLAKSDFKKVKEILDKLIGIKTKEKDKKKKGKKDVVKPKAADVDEAAMEAAQNILDEWNCVIHGEAIRAKLRVDLLKHDFFMNLDETLGTIRTVFYKMYDDIRDSHDKEMKSVNAVCDILSLAVEKEVKIQEELVLDKEDFYVNPEVILFPDELPDVKPLAETVKRGVFTIEQLDKILDIFLDLAPKGYMPERSFVYLLQDMIVNKDDPILVPQLWQELEPSHLEKIAKWIFDDAEYVQWRDFIVISLMVPFPTEEEIMWLRRCFRELDPDCTELITDYQYYSINYWFECEVSDSLRLKRMRQLLYKMYRVKGDCMNYTALLLDFCKDRIPALGLAKALGVCIGKQVCFNKDTGENFVKMHRQELRQNETLKRKQQAVLKGVMRDILTEVVQTLPIDYGKVKALPSDVEVVPRSPDSSTDSVASEEELEEQDLDIGPVPDLMYFLPLDALITVVTSCLPWNAKVQNIEDKSFREVCAEIYESCRCSEFGNQVLCHEFLNDPALAELLATTSKFSVRNLLVVLEEVLEEVEKTRSKTRKF